MNLIDLLIERFSFLTSAVDSVYTITMSDKQCAADEKSWKNIGKKAAVKTVVAGGLGAGAELALGGSPMNGLWLGGSQAVSTLALSIIDLQAPSSVSQYADESHEQRYLDTLLTGGIYTGVQAYRGKSSLMKHFLIGAGASLASDILYEDVAKFMPAQ